MSADWIDLRVGETKPKRLVTYLTVDGRKIQNVCHEGGRSIVSIRLRKYSRLGWEWGVPIPQIYCVSELSEEAAKKFLNYGWRRRNGI